MRNHLIDGTQIVVDGMHELAGVNKDLVREGQGGRGTALSVVKFDAVTTFDSRLAASIALKHVISVDM